MPFKIIKFDKLLNEIKKTHPLEENLSKIIRDIEIEFDFESLGLFVYDKAFQGYRLKIGRNLSHHFEKNTTFYDNDELIKELKKLEPIHSDKYQFEHKSSDVLIVPLYFQNEFFGFIFLDRVQGKYDEQNLSKLCMFSSVCSMVIFIFKQNQLIKNLNEYEEHTGIYSSESFKKLLLYLFEHSNRYNHNLSVAMFTFAKHYEILRTFGKSKINKLEKHIVEIISKHIRKTDKIGRSHNHIILIAMPETAKEKAIKPIERIINEIKELSLMKDISFIFGILELKKGDDVYKKIKKSEFMLEEAIKNNQNFIIIED